MKKYRIGVLFCGGCNCYFDREQLYEDMKRELAGSCEFFLYDTDRMEACDLVVLINGCQSECLMGDAHSYSAKLLLINNRNCDKAIELVKRELDI